MQQAALMQKVQNQAQAQLSAPPQSRAEHIALEGEQS
jgi:hypothetical protein